MIKRYDNPKDNSGPACCLGILVVAGLVFWYFFGRCDMIALDTETTGVDFDHGARPFCVTVCDEQDTVTCWEWPVDPLTRTPIVPEEDAQHIRDMVDAADSVVLHNAKFDVTALKLAGIVDEWPWHKTDDTLVASHLISSNTPHNLTDLTAKYLFHRIEDYETALEVHVKEARLQARKHFPDWQIAKADHPQMPSAGEKTWRYDYWLPKALAVKMSHPANHPWHRVLSDYACQDSPATLHLMKKFLGILRKNGWEKLYRHRMRLVPVLWRIQRHGLTFSKKRLVETMREYEQGADEAGKDCERIAKEHYNYDLKMPDGPVNQSLSEFAFGVAKFPVVVVTEKGKPSLDSDTAIPHYIDLYSPDSVQHRFCRNIEERRGRKSAIQYMKSYLRYGLDSSRRKVGPFDTSERFLTLHPNINQTGTDTVRKSSDSPNGQNISKQKRFNVRYTFGPKPGRTWYTMDAQNIELRIPAFKAGEQDLIDVFLNPDKAPYFGSYHLVVFDLLYPELFREHGKAVKDLFDSTYYQWVKNGNFSIIYGAQREKADFTYHVEGAFDKVHHRFPKMSKLGKSKIEMANRLGYVETVPQKSVDPLHGYPVRCSRSERGSVSPTVPFNYFVQSTAAEWMDNAMIRVDEFYQYLNNGGKFLKKRWAGGYHIAMTIHDELIHDMPLVGENPEYNLPVVAEVKRLMELGGDDIGVPVPVSVKHCPVNWRDAIGVAV